MENSRVVFVGGQPGAGKTKLFKLSMEEFSDGNVLPINTDELRAFHPQFVEITETEDKLSAERTSSGSLSRRTG